MTPSARFSALVLLASLPFAAPASAQIQAAEERPSVTVTGEGVVYAKPDMATIELGVVAEADDAAGALSDNNAAMARITDALKGEGIEARDLQTSNFTVEPRYSQPPRDPAGQQDWTPEIVGYTVRNTLTVRVRDLAELGPVLDQVVRLGANSISGPTFTVAEPGDLEDSARAAAVRDARERAETYAEAAGITLGDVRRIEEVDWGRPQPMPMARAMKAEAFDASVPIESGELTFTARVGMSWSIAE